MYMAVAAYIIINAKCHCSYGFGVYSFGATTNIIAITVTAFSDSGGLPVVTAVAVHVHHFCIHDHGALRLLACRG